MKKPLGGGWRSGAKRRDVDYDGGRAERFLSVHRTSFAISSPHPALCQYASEHLCLVLYAGTQMTRRFRSNATWASIAPAPGSKAGVIEVRITGPFTLEAFHALRQMVIDATRGAPAIIVRLDTAVDVLFEPPAFSAQPYRAGAPPQAVVVHASQYMLWLRHADNLRKIGVRRAVFTVARLAAAKQWAELAALHRPGVITDDPETSGPAPLD